MIRMVQTALLGGDLVKLRLYLAEALVVEEPRYRYDRQRLENPGGYIVETLQSGLPGPLVRDP